MMTTIHVGNRISQILRERGMTVSEFSSLLPCSRENAYRILKKENIDTGLLLKISHILSHDFFRDISSSIPGDKFVED